MALNQCTFLGRVVRDHELRYTQTGKAVVSFGLAVEHDYRGQDGKRGCDFVNCTAWDKCAELIAQYTHKGSRILVSGRLQNKSYQNKEGFEVKTFEVNVRDVTLIDFKRGDNEKKDDGQEDDLPF